MILASLPQISLGTAAVLIFAGCLTYVLLRGVGRLMIGTAVLAASAFLGYLTWLRAPGISVAVFDKSLGFITTGLPVLVFVVSFILLRVALKWIANPFGGGDKEEMKDRRGLSKGRLFSLLAFALVPTAMVMMIIAAIVHHKAAVDDLFIQANDGAVSPETTWAQEIRDSIEVIVPESILNAIDPFAEKSRLALAKLVTRQQKESELEPAINPETGEVIPRAIIVEDAELERLAREQKFGTLLRHPALTKALESPEVRKLVDDLDF